MWEMTQPEPKFPSSAASLVISIQHNSSFPRTVCCTAVGSIDCGVVNIRNRTIDVYPNMPGNRCSAGSYYDPYSQAVFVFGGIAVTGDSSSDYTPKASAEQLSLPQRTWTVLPAMPHTRCSFNVCSLFPSLYLSGGISSDGAIDSFDVLLRQYTTLRATIPCNTSVSSVVVEGVLCAFYQHKLGSERVVTDVFPHQQRDKTTDPGAFAH